MDDEFLSGDKLSEYKKKSSGKCWWCNSAADTSEHKFKASDLRRMNRQSSDGLIWGSEGSLINVRSIRKSQVVKFNPNLCAKCNNQRSQPFDLAYEEFSEYIWSRMDNLWEAPFIDMKEIYGADWPTGVLNLARYIVKHMGCRMDHDGYPVPDSFAGFLEGGTLLPGVHMATFKDPRHWDLYKNHDGASGLWIAPANGAVSPSRKVLTMYSSSLTVGYVGIFYRWEEDTSQTDPFYQYRRPRLHRRDELPAI